ncbi:MULTISPECIES: hypothetical protein [Flavobacteriaceae]|uniref:hypothetical protein n=1 Tax=Flavobacteriaceae TaxID=49546 RepID=UPI00234A8675|nr:hypothetical protein [Muricauda sp. SP22]MDC6361651.1 hypothetical protein [Muricauda sp. SP22]
MIFYTVYGYSIVPHVSYIMEQGAEGDMSLTEFLIAFSIVMMMLSFVSERVSNFLKLHFQGKSIWIPYPHTNNGFKWGMRTNIKILAHKQPTDVMEKEREYRILLINIIVGIAIATFCNANFFEIVNNISRLPDDDSTNKTFSIISGWRFSDLEEFKWELIVGGFYLLALVWSLSLIFFNRLPENNAKISPSAIRIPFYSILTVTLILLLVHIIEDNFPFTMIEHAFGFIITGLFLSLGSKFWHDLLDFLFRVKNVQQRVNERDTYTQFDKPDRILALANTSHYQIAEELFKEYEDEIWKIHGVVSVGLKSKFDTIDGFFKRKIEVEYTTAEAQERLQQLSERGMVTIELNSYYLRDYLVTLYTEELIAAYPLTEVAATVGSERSIKEVRPVCYAYNMDSTSSMGSFGVFKENEKYFAHSNLHVFATPTDLKRFDHGSVKELKSNHVGFRINENDYQNSKILSFSFGNGGTYGEDYCLCEISKEIYDAYRAHVGMDQLEASVSEDKMTMFGAVSKTMSFKKYREITRCRVNYGSFIKELKLIKIESTYLNVSKGDSGSIVKYKVYGVGGQLFSREGMIVAKSRKYAYMMKLS